MTFTDIVSGLCVALCLVLAVIGLVLAWATKLKHAWLAADARDHDEASRRLHEASRWLGADHAPTQFLLKELAGGADPGALRNRWREMLREDGAA